MNSIQHSPFRTVFESPDLRDQFSSFLHTIFYQLDDQKVFEKMDQILADRNKTEEQIYTELVEHIDQMRKPFAPLHQLKALSVLLKGMGSQAATLLKDLRPEEFHHYAEVYFKRYLRTIQKIARIPLDGRIYAISDQPSTGTLKEKLESGSLFKAYPYRQHVPLNEPECTTPEEQVDKTYKELEGEIADGSLDLVTALGGFHHIPKDKMTPFVESLHRKLRPGGVVLLRDHNVTSEALRDMVSVVHSFVNAADKKPWSIESGEVRDFQSLTKWTEFMQRFGFERISNDQLILQDDPTQNAMLAFARKPKTVEELKIAAKFRKDSFRLPDCTRATWIEWGNVRYASQYAKFIQSKHYYAFDHLGHLQQHWKYFTTYLSESKKDMSLKEIVLSDNFSMNVFILTGVAFQSVVGFLGSLPSAALARITKGAHWRECTDLTVLEKQNAKIEEEYSQFINHTPFYMFPYVSKIRSLWNAVWNSNESLAIKALSSLEALASTVGFLFKAAVCIPIRLMNTQNQECIEPDKIGILIYDPKDQFESGEKWIRDQNHPTQVIYETEDHHKLVLVPRYRKFTDLCKSIAKTQNGVFELLEVGGQEKITVDVELGKEDVSIVPSGSTLLYEMEKLQDEKQHRYSTYEVKVRDLFPFMQALGVDRIEYIHE